MIDKMNLFRKLAMNKIEEALNQANVHIEEEKKY